MKVNDVADLQQRYDLLVELQKSKLVNKKNEVLSKYEDYNEFIKSIEYHLIERSGDPNFQTFYNVYDKIFTIEEEKESYSGFEEVLDFNFDQSLQKKFGPFKEVLLYCTTPDDEDVIGGINFATYYYPNLFDKSFGTSHIFYLFVKPEYRSFNLGTELIQKAENFSKSLLFEWINKNNHHVDFPEIELIVFCEQNYPEKMTLLQYWKDNMNSLTDQCDRLKWWNKRGFRRLNMNYVQPALNIENEPCLYLSLNAKTGLQGIPSFIVLEHIKRIFSISVLKGRDIEDDINYKKIENYLKSQSTIVFSSIDDYESIKETIYQYSNSENSYDILIKNLFKK
ncbi:MAG TPA: GNAT family N-acetyltransferase [Draconibacterium sp.]|nr:GNAT family N-acetyltransferase [Draconibacterium sp.]